MSLISRSSTPTTPFGGFGVRQRHRSAVVPWFSSHPTQDYLSAFESAKRRVTLSVQAEPDRSIPRG